MIEVQLPDGSLASFPPGTSPDKMKAEIERFLASRQNTPRGVQPPAAQDSLPNVDRSVQAQPRPAGPGNQEERLAWDRANRDRFNLDGTERQPAPAQAQGYQQPTMGATELNTPAVRNAGRGQPLSIRDAIIQEQQAAAAGPSARNGTRDGRQTAAPFEEDYGWSGAQQTPDARQPEQPAQEAPKTQRQLDAEAQRNAVWGTVGGVANRVAGGVSAAGNAVYGAAADVTGGALSILGATDTGAALERQSDIAYNVASDQLREGYLSGKDKTEADYDVEPQDFRAQRKAERAAAKQTQADIDAQIAAAKAAETGQTTAVPAQAASGPTGALPSPADPNAGQRTNLSMPKSMSTQPAQPGQQGQQGQQGGMRFDMADGQSVQVRTAPPAAMKKGTQSGLDYLIGKSDEIMTKMLQNGDITGATQFRDFVRNEQTAAGLGHMNAAIVASTYGDSKAFTSSVSQMVESLDGDGPWQVDTAGTRLIETDTGQAVGAVLSLRNTDTGEVMTQEYTGMKNVMAALSDWGSPTAAFERQQERVAAASAQVIAQAEDYQTAFDEAFEAMFEKSSFVGLDGSAIPQEEMAKRVEMVRERIRQVRPDLVPADKRGAAAPSASGVGGTYTGGSNGQPVPTWGG